MTSKCVLLLVLVGTFLGMSLCSNYSYLNEYQRKLCPPVDNRCEHAGEKVGPCCGYCDCGPNCAKYGSCCWTAYNNLSQAQQSVKDSRYRCVRPQYFTSSKKTNHIRTHNSHPSWMVARCGLSETDKIARALCEHPGINGSVDSIVPVRYGNEDYRNKFCAFCNGLHKSTYFINWKLEIQCEDSILGHAVTKSNLLAVVEEKRCNIFYRPPDERVTEKCTEQIYSISKCNVSGSWPVYDLDIDIACNSFVDAFNYTYRNYYCYLCNTDNPIPKSNWQCLPREFEGGTSQPPFVAILDLSLISRLSPDTQELECDSETQYKDEKMMKCRNILCDRSRYLQDQKCLLKDHLPSDELCYVVFIKLTDALDEKFFDDQMRESSFLTALQQAFKDVLGDQVELVDKFNVYGESTFRVIDQKRIVNYMIVKIIVHNSLHKKIDILSDLIQKLHFRSVKIQLTVGQMTFHTEVVSYNITLFADVDKFLIAVPTETGTSHDYLEHFLITQHILPVLPSTRCDNKTQISFDRLHVCPFVEINVKDLQMEVSNEFLVINESFIYKTISGWGFRRKTESVFICVNEYKTLNDAMPSREKPQEMIIVGPKETLSLVCVCLSVICLLTTIIIYISFSELHSQPGINTIILCVLLLLSQTLYQFGAGQTDLPKWACATIGAFCHFLWLSVMFAMNVCSYEMFRIFRKLQNTPSRFMWRDTCQRLLYIIVSSLFFVLLNFIVSYFSSGGRDSGYGGAICFLSSVRLHLITFIIPSGTLIILNCLLFFYVVVKIGQTRISVARLNYERNYFGIYARLSTLTGLTWLFGFLQLFVQNEVLEYQFIILNAGQGIFIMIAFILNRRIFKLCRHTIVWGQSQSKEMQEVKTKSHLDLSLNLTQ